MADPAKVTRRSQAFRARAAQNGHRRLRFGLGADLALRLDLIRDSTGLSSAQIVDALILHPDASEIVRRAAMQG